MLYIQDLHDKSTKKEFLSHTINNEAINFIFLALLENDIQKRFEEATLCFGDALSSRAEVGPGERTTPPEAVIMSVNGTTMEASRDSDVL